jgi:glycosyltransferase involved in cell wall biosynthesis
VSAAPAIGVLHITAAEGGGADRYIRDLAATTAARHWIWHAGVGFIENAASHRYFTAAGDDALRRWAEDAGLGLMHLHGVDDACRAVLARLRGARHGLPWIITLHDAGFIARDAFTQAQLAADPVWIASLRPCLAGASALVAASDYIAGLLARHYKLPAVRIEPGLRAMPAPPPATTQSSPRPVVAVAGALGPHKGSALLAPLAARLEAAGIDLVVIGYTDTQLLPGRDASRRYTLTGVYEDGQLPALLAAHAARLVLFVNRLPESFSYTLSEVWAAGYPVLVPDAGALGERVHRHGGGWCYAPETDAATLAATIAALLAPENADDWRRVKSAIVPNDTRRVPPLATMASTFDTLYQRVGLPRDAAPDADAALDRLAAANFDGFAFRHELAALARLPSEQQAWIAKLERDIAELKQALEELERVKAAFDVLPAFAQKILFKLRQAIRDRR